MQITACEAQTNAIAAFEEVYLLISLLFPLWHPETLIVSIFSFISVLRSLSFCFFFGLWTSPVLLFKHIFSDLHFCTEWFFIPVRGITGNSSRIKQAKDLGYQCFWTIPFFPLWRNGRRTWGTEYIMSGLSYPFLKSLSFYFPSPHLFLFCSFLSFRIMYLDIRNDFFQNQISTRQSRRPFCGWSQTVWTPV